MMKHNRHSEEANYIMSVSDVMAGLMFIFIITLAIFVIDFMDASSRHQEIVRQLEVERNAQKEIAEELERAEQKARQENERLQVERNIARGILSELTSNQRGRTHLLNQIQVSLKSAGISVIIDEKHGVMRLDENAIQFQNGEAALSDMYLNRLIIIANVMEEILPCYARNQPEAKHCLPETVGKLDSIFIEGHTDNVPIRGALRNKYSDNWELSTARANYTFRKLVIENDYLLSMNNLNGQPIFSVSGYGEGRPLPGHEYDEPKSDLKNRRIDFRFIMSPPVTTEAQAALDGNL
ncbi:OmpA family protein [Photobacterium sagamiensis]|uniref:hypothetical protein n=1 Tax=Photobacterium sagamiensis TaxID=2910241 RepID=UPI003D0F5EE1